MTDLLDDTWNSRDLPVLREVARHLDQSQHRISVEEVADATDLSPEDVVNAGRALELGQLVTVLKAMGHPVLAFTGISADARRHTGLWPSPEAAADRLLAALGQAAERATDPEQKTRLERAGELLRAAGRDITVGVATAVLTGQLPK